MPEVIAGLIRTMTAELRAEAVEWTAMRSRSQTFDDQPRCELEIIDRRDDSRVERAHGDYGRVASSSLPTT